MTRAAIATVRVFLVLFLTFLASQALAQYGSSLEGVITDQTGATVSGAKVTATCWAGD